MGTRGGGFKKTRAGVVSVSVTIPEGVYADMIRIVETERRWTDRVDFAREAIKEKVEREKREHPLGLPLMARKG